MGVQVESLLWRSEEKPDARPQAPLPVSVIVPSALTSMWPIGLPLGGLIGTGDGIPEGPIDGLGLLET